MEIILIFFIFVIVLKNITAFRGILLARKFLRRVEGGNVSSTSPPFRLLLLIPVLREQNVILTTLDHFKRLDRNNMRVHLIVCGTVRETACGQNGGHATKEVVREWIEQEGCLTDSDLTFEFVEAPDFGGDRASQLNYAAAYYFENDKHEADAVGVYDADSQPGFGTLQDVRRMMESGAMCVQQPVHFLAAASGLAEQGASPILVANALYQTMWTMIRELPRWYSNWQHSPKNSYPRNLYLIGHGEFFSLPVFRQFGFPAGEVTDGIQLGYRLAMSGVRIAPIRSFCEDDVPRFVVQLVQQHKRWYGGCMRLIQSYRWSRTAGLLNNPVAILQMLDGYWSQLSWAFATPSVALAILCWMWLPITGSSLALGGILLLNLGVYCYLLPYLSMRMIGISCRVRARDWLSMPLAIAVKCIGPNLYFLERLVTFIRKNHKIRYQKVER